MTLEQAQNETGNVGKDFPKEETTFHENENIVCYRYRHRSSVIWRFGSLQEAVIFKSTYAHTDIEPLARYEHFDLLLRALIDAVVSMEIASHLPGVSDEYDFSEPIRSGRAALSRILEARAS